MNKLLEIFKNWVMEKESEWLSNNIILEDFIESTHAIQFHVKLRSADGLGNISFYESNNIYWIEFEGVARDFESFYRYIEFDIFPDLKDFENEFIHFLAGSS